MAYTVFSCNGDEDRFVGTMRELLRKEGGPASARRASGEVYEMT